MSLRAFDHDNLATDSVRTQVELVEGSLEIYNVGSGGGFVSVALAAAPILTNLSTNHLRQFVESGSDSYYQGVNTGGVQADCDPEETF